MECDKSRIDYVALHLLPTDAPDGYAPVSIFGDGNCFPRAEFCVWIIYELVLHKNMYLNDEYVSKGASVVCHRGNTVDQIAMFSENYNPLQKLPNEEYFKLEVLDICMDGAYIGMWQILAAANIMVHPIRSVYLDVR